MDWKGLSVLVTGGTGSFGKKFIEIMLRDYHPRRLIVFSRDELKQNEMLAGGLNDRCMRYFLGDIRDKDRLRRALSRVDIVIHAAAMKQVPACEYNPIEAIKTNVDGAQNIIEAALDAGVSKVMALSTDKAVNPVNLYGATKLCMEKLIVQSNAYTRRDGTIFSCTRYGNVVGSRGSVIPVFLEQCKNGKVTVTDERMTRFWLTLEQGVRFVIRCIELMEGGEVFVPKLPSMKVMDLAKAIAPSCEIDLIGIRPGEKVHETLISADEARRVVEYKDIYVIQPAYSWWRAGEYLKDGMPLPEGFAYTSDHNDQWLSMQELQRMIGI